MVRMTDPQWREFVMDGTRTGKLAVTRPDGRPHVSPVWFVLDSDDVVMTTGAATVKGQALRHDPRVALCVDDQEPHYSFVMMQGRATLSEDLADLRRWATVLGGRYMGEDRAEEFGARNGVPGELLVRLRVAHVVAERDIAG